MAEPTVLFVDDDIDMGELVAAALMPRGFVVVLEHRLERARDRLALRDVDVVVTDVTLADGGNGFDLCREVSHLRPDLPVIVLTGDRDAEPIAREAGASGFLVKPVSMTRLAETIHGVLAPEGTSAAAP